MNKETEIATKVRNLRIELSLTRKNLADILELSEPTIVRWEEAKGTGRAINSLQLLNTLEWLYEEVQKENCNVQYKYIFSLILGSTESKKAMEKMKAKGFGWITIGLVAAASFAVIPLGLVFGGLFINAAMQGKLALNKKNNEELFKKLKAYTNLYGAKGLLYLASQIRMGIKIK